MRKRTTALTLQTKKELVYSTRIDPKTTSDLSAAKTLVSKTSGAIERASERLSAHTLFGAFTADILKQNTLFTR